MSTRQTQKKTSKFEGFPTSLSIMGRPFTVKLVDLKPDLYGDCEASEQLIRINQNNSEAMGYQTLFHEAVHAALGISGLAYILSEKSDGNDSLEEALVTCIEHAFIDAIDITKLQK